MVSKPNVPADGLKWIASRSHFKVWIKVLNGHKFVGCFKTFEDAYAARKQATIEYLEKRSLAGERRTLQKPLKNSKSGVTGVRWIEKRKRWQALVKVDKKQIHLGFFVDKDAAIAARQAANVKYGFFPSEKTGEK
jgi:hypothetical protein